MSQSKVTARGAEAEGADGRPVAGSGEEVDCNLCAVHPWARAEVWQAPICKLKTHTLVGVGEGCRSVGDGAEGVVEAKGHCSCGQLDQESGA